MSNKEDRESKLPETNGAWFAVWCCILAGVLADKNLYGCILRGEFTTAFGWLLYHAIPAVFLYVFMKAFTEVFFGKKINQMKKGRKWAIFGATLLFFAILYYAWRVVIGPRYFA